MIAPARWCACGMMVNQPDCAVLSTTMAFFFYECMVHMLPSASIAAVYDYLCYMGVLGCTYRITTFRTNAI